MSILEQWNHKWFGVWHEYGPSYECCPHIHEFIIPEVALKYDKSRLREYLTKAQIVSSTSRASFPCPFTGKRTAGSISFRTDGEWLWLDDLPDYIDQFNVAIPSSWLRKIEANNYVFPTSIDAYTIERLEWPPISQ